MARSTIFAYFLLPALLLLLCCFPMPVGADVVPISISQRVSVFANVTACDYFCSGRYYLPDDPGQNFSPPTQTNITLPPADLSLSGSATDSVTVFNHVRMAQVDASASQTITLNPTNFNLDLHVSDEFSGIETLMNGGVSADSQYSLVFDLTSPYLVHLTGDIFGGSNVGIGGFNGSFDGEIHLTGLGFQFDQAFPTFFDEVFTLGPGQYTLDAGGGWNASQSYVLDSNSSFDVSLNAGFTPIPEPLQVSIVLGLVVLAGVSFARRHWNLSGN